MENDDECSFMRGCGICFFLYSVLCIVGLIWALSGWIEYFYYLDTNGCLLTNKGHIAPVFAANAQICWMAFFGCPLILLSVPLITENLFWTKVFYVGMWLFLIGESIYVAISCSANPLYLMCYPTFDIDIALLIVVFVKILWKRKPEREDK